MITSQDTTTKGIKEVTDLGICKTGMPSRLHGEGLSVEGVPNEY
jgi:hypothetical protein